MSQAAVSPSLVYERRLWAMGYRAVAGLDEAGRGAWAGPVVAAAVIFDPKDHRLAQSLAGVRDSKRLTPRRREDLFQVVVRQAVAWGLGTVQPGVIDGQGVVPATKRAMVLALESLQRPPDSLLIDHLVLSDLALPQQSLPKGDARVLSIAAASILAKVCRDRLMVELDSQYPGYGLAQHKGYGTAQHRAALRSCGPCPAHRLSFAPLKALDAGTDGSRERSGRME